MFVTGHFRLIRVTNQSVRRRTKKDGINYKKHKGQKSKISLDIFLHLMQMTYGGGVYEEGQIEVRGSTNVTKRHKL